MNAFSLLRATEYIGAKELRIGLDKILRQTDHPYRVMLHNRPALAILPDDQFIELLEIMEELKDSGYLTKIRGKLRAESRKKRLWFWSEAWQKGEKEVDDAIKAGRTKSFKSVNSLVKHLHK